MFKWKFSPRSRGHRERDFRPIGDELPHKILKSEIGIVRFPSLEEFKVKLSLTKNR